MSLRRKKRQEWYQLLTKSAFFCETLPHTLFSFFIFGSQIFLLVVSTAFTKVENVTNPLKAVQAFRQRYEKYYEMIVPTMNSLLSAL
jgi:hypothetical protein